MNNKNPDELLRDGIIELEFTPSKEQLNAFMTYLSELKKWNKAYNLTGLKNDKDIVIKHFFDSLLYLKAISVGIDSYREGEIRVADVGSGAGFPGIPMKIMRPEIEMYLIEPSRKKSAFLRHVIRRLELKQIEVIENRIEEIKVNQELAQPVNVALTRALFSIKEFLKKAFHIVKKEGIFIFNKGPKVKGEISMLGDIRYEILTLTLPLSEIVRHLVIIRLTK
jgi:16S rRNA (guanine527-N7)-methyltransferase